MGQIVGNLIRDWSGGLNTAVSPDELPDNTTPFARNSALTLVGAVAVPQKRKGMAVQNRIALTGNATILGMVQFKRLSGGTYTSYHLLVSNGGRLDKLLSDGTTAAADVGSSTPFTSGDLFPSFASARNLMFIVNGTDKIKFDGTDVWNFGITKPASAPTLAAGAAGTPNGTYEARVTFYNSNTGHESSAGPTSNAQAVVNQQISFTSIPTSADAQVTARRLYLRNTATMANFYLAGTVNDNTTTTFTYNAADSTLVTIGPNTTENDPPPSGVKFLAWHKNRMFAADASKLYYSKIDFPESFPPDNYEPINQNDSDDMTGVHAPGGDILLVMKRNATYALVGDDPETWSLERLSADIGCTSNLSITTVENITRWWSEVGPVAWVPGTTGPVAFARQVIGPSIDSSALAFAHIHKICSAPDFTNQRVYFAVPEVGQTRNTLIIVFNYRLGVFESFWDPFDIASLATVEDSNNVPNVFAGNYGGQVFKVWSGGNDGVFEGTKVGEVHSHTSTTLTYSFGSFDTTGAGLKERMVYIIDPANTSVQRRRITANTSTVLTVSPDISGTVTGYDFIVGGPDWKFDTKNDDAKLPFVKKRLEFLYSEALASSAGQEIEIDVDIFKDGDTAQPVKTTSFSLAGTGGIWNQDNWGEFTWGAPGRISTRARMALTARKWRVRYRNRNVDEDVTLVKTGMRAELLTDKS